jgi:hypothetical protein
MAVSSIAAAAVYLPGDTVSVVSNLESAISLLDSALRKRAGTRTMADYLRGLVPWANVSAAIDVWNRCYSDTAYDETTEPGPCPSANEEPLQ